MGEQTVDMALGHCWACGYAPQFVGAEIVNPPAGWVLTPASSESQGMPVATGHSRGCRDLPGEGVLATFSAPSTLLAWTEANVAGEG